MAKRSFVGNESCVLRKASVVFVETGRISKNIRREEMFFTQFGLLFSNMEWFVLVCFIAGLVLIFVEMLEPGFGAFGITGSICLVASIVLRAVFRKDEDVVVMQIFQFVLLDAIIFGILFLFMFIAHKKGWLKKSAIFRTGTAVDEKFSDGTKNYLFLLGKQGDAVTVLRPSGKAEIEGVIYDVESDGFLIEKGVKIKVCAVEGGIIKVTKVVD